MGGSVSRRVIKLWCVYESAAQKRQNNARQRAGTAVAVIFDCSKPSSHTIVRKPDKSLRLMSSACSTRWRVFITPISSPVAISHACPCRTRPLPALFWLFV